MPTNNKKKSLKKIKGKEVAHPYSRKAQQMRRALHRMEAMSTKQAVKNNKQTAYTDKLLFFKYAVQDDSITHLPLDEMHQLVEMYINRHEDEIEKLTPVGKRTKSNRLVLLASLRDSEMQEYKGSGIEIPDLGSKSNVEVLRKWEGDYNGRDLIKMIHLVKKE